MVARHRILKLTRSTRSRGRCRLHGLGVLKNGELARTAEESGVDVFLTGDGTLSYGQNLTGRRLAVVALSTIQLPVIGKHLPRTIAAMDSALPGSFQAVDCGTFSGKKLPGQ